MAEKSAKSPPASPSFDRAALVLPFALIALLTVMLVPLPPVVIDVMLVLSIAASLATLIIAIGIDDPMAFTVFPTLLLTLTLYRLALNVAATRLILAGNGGDGAAGRVIGAFGEFVVGGNYLVGLVVFAILLVINFVVITKGAGRIAEVAARFTLDALPGKQMAIDADLNAGLIDDKQARARRQQVGQEADFYGAMDGSSKFVRGDAIAALIITAINIVGGFLIGIFQHDLTMKDSATRYTSLTVGDGLASQIPALIVSVAAAVVVTRVSKGVSLSRQVTSQIAADTKSLYTAAGIVSVIGFLPGMPFIPFVLVGGIFAGVAHWGRNKKIVEEAVEPEPELSPAMQEEAELSRSMNVEPLALTIGYDLVPLLDKTAGGDLPDRIQGLRKRIAQDMGVIVPPVHISDDPTLSGGRYAVHLNGSVVAKGDLYAERFLAMDPTGHLPPLPGIKGKDPAFGLPAIWIAAADRERAAIDGWTVIPPTAVLTTHLSEVIRQNAAEILTRDDLQRLLDGLAAKRPKAVKDLVPDVLPLTIVLTVCRNLLRERIPIKDLGSVIDALAEGATATKEPEPLTEHVRKRLARVVSAQFADRDGCLYVATIDPKAEDLLVKNAKADTAPPPGSLEKIITSIGNAARSMVNAGRTPVIVASGDVRRALRQLVARTAPGTHVISYDEVADAASLKTVARIGFHGELA